MPFLKYTGLGSTSITSIDGYNMTLESGKTLEVSFKTYELMLDSYRTYFEFLSHEEVNRRDVAYYIQMLKDSRLRVYNKETGGEEHQELKAGDIVTVMRDTLVSLQHSDGFAKTGILKPGIPLEEVEQSNTETIETPVEEKTQEKEEVLETIEEEKQEEIKEVVEETKEALEEVKEEVKPKAPTKKAPKKPTKRKPKKRSTSKKK